MTRVELGLTGKVALITGASKGIGAATARILASEGCDVVLVARSIDALERIATDIRDTTGRHAVPFSADLSNADEVERLAAHWGHADVLVNNAGAIPGGRLEDVDDKTWRTAWDLKVFGYINLTRALLPVMRSRCAGTVVNVIGAGAQIRDPSYICGVAANAALTAFTMSLGSESPQYGVRVVGVSPGPVATDRLAQLEAQKVVGLVDATSRPFGRAATPEEIAWAVAFLASPLSAYTSGTVVMVDGGMSASSAAL